MKTIATLLGVVLSAAFIAMLVTVWTYESPAKFDKRFGVWHQIPMKDLKKPHQWDPSRRYA